MSTSEATTRFTYVASATPTVVTSDEIVVGGTMLVRSDRLSIGVSGQKRGGFELASNAQKVTVEVLSAEGSLVDEITLQNLEGGRHFFEWTAKPWMTDPVSFRVLAISDGTPVPTTHLTRVRIGATAPAPRASLEKSDWAGDAPSGHAMTLH